MKAFEVREHASEELEDKLAELKEELFNLRFRLATGQLDNHRRIPVAKREVARIRTVLRERELGAADEPELEAPAEELPEEEATE